jgi:hypothetical protein
MLERAVQSVDLLGFVWREQQLGMLEVTFICIRHLFPQVSTPCSPLAPPFDNRTERQTPCKGHRCQCPIFPGVKAPSAPGNEVSYSKGCRPLNQGLLKSRVQPPLSLQDSHRSQSHTSVPSLQDRCLFSASSIESALDVVDAFRLPTTIAIASGIPFLVDTYLSFVQFRLVC